MKKIFASAAFLAAFVLSACKGESKLTDQELMEKNVRNYFFMGDSVAVSVTVTDTVFTDELDFMIANTEENFNLVQLDIDTLELMIDDWSYKGLEFEKSGNTSEAQAAKIKALEYKIKHQELQIRQAEFAQTNRIFMHLKRSTWANISGYEAKVHYELGDEVNDMVVLMDANFNVVD